MLCYRANTVFMKKNADIDTTKEGQYCLKCNSTKIERVFKDGKTYYFCEDCLTTAERTLVIDNAVNWWIDKERNYWHESAGVIVLNEKGEWLIAMRVIFPFAYALSVGGHVDKGENALDVARRETLEEIGLDLPKEDFKFVREFHLPGDSCRRGSDHHLWHLYMTKIDSRKEIHLNDEASNFLWLKPDEIKTRKDIVYPLKYILENIEI